MLSIPENSLSPVPIRECRSQLLPLLAYRNEEGGSLFRVSGLSVEEKKQDSRSVSLKTKLIYVMDLQLEPAFKFGRGGLSCMANCSLLCYKS